MIRIDTTLTPASLRKDIERLFEASAGKIFALERTWDPAMGAPVVSVAGRYTSRGWTEWTQGFQFGSAILQFAATGDRRALATGRDGTVQHMARHVSHVGVHDHGFNVVSTYGNLYQLAKSGAMRANEGELRSYELALKVSGAVQAARWTSLPGGQGYIYSFNGPHSLFADTMRSLRILALSHSLGHALMGENDLQISLLGRLLAHAETSTLGRGATSTTRGGASRTSPSSTSMTVPTGARAPSRATRRSRPGRAGSPGFSAATPSSSSSSTPCRAGN